ncbi:MAG: long-chain fatty acid--CoA ligase [Deltaproteobacteria bacterium]|nr:long-chain fatty acid--CoA ligase [Deltaproteobacteria bacterium]
MAEPITLVQHLAAKAAARGDAAALCEMDDDGSWLTTTWQEYSDVVRAIGKGLIWLGLEPGDIVAQVGANRREWVWCQFGVMAAAGTIAPIYTTNTAEQAGYIVGHCRAKIAFCDTAEQLDKFLEGQRQELFDLDFIFTMDEIEVGDRADGFDVEIASLSTLIERGQAGDDAELDRRIAAAELDDLALLVFTSGTTGLPKGAELTHRSIRAIGDMFRTTYAEAFKQKQRYISYLPLCHAAEQGFTNFVGLRVEGVTYFCRDLTQVRDYLVAVRPTIFFGVPRVWEKFEAVLRGRLAEAKGIKARLAEWALATEFEAFERTMETGEEQRSWQRTVAKVLVVGKIQKALGLDALIAAGGGAAPMARSTLEFFASLGIPILEGFGMTETSAFATVQPLGRPRLGTVGKPLFGPRGAVEVKIADDGEIMLRGDNMIRGYLRLPEKTAELYTDGWMHTGDLGSVDEDGFMSITGRKKDLIITAGGKNVAPVEIEHHLKAIPGVGQAVVVGDRQRFLSALLVLDEEALPELCAAAKVPVAPMGEVAADERVRQFIRERIEKDCNPELARYQTIKRFEILDEPFSVESGELTPTLKVKRNVVNEKYDELIQGMYA